MDPLIKQLEHKIVSLTSKLAESRQEITLLRQQLNTALNTEERKLANHKKSLPGSSHLETYIGDTLDFSTPVSKYETLSNCEKKTIDQLSFELPFSSPSKESENEQE